MKPLRQRFVEHLHPIGVGLVFGLGFSHPALWWMALLAPIYAVYYTAHIPPSRPALWWWQLGFAKQLLVLSWFWSAYPLDWIGVNSSLLQIFFVLINWIPAALLTSVGYLFFGYVLSRIRVQRVLFWSVVTLGWLLADLLGALAFSVYVLGPGSSLNAAFSFGWVGYLLAAHPLLLPIAQLYGVYALSILFGALTAIGSWMLKRSPAWQRVGVCTLLVLIVTTWLPLPVREVGEGEQVIAVVTTNFDRLASPSAADRALQKSVLQEIATELTATSHDYAVLPEDLRFVSRLADAPQLADYFAQAADAGSVLVDTKRQEIEATTLEAALYDLAHSTTTPDTFAKQYLVPQGEYLPYIYMKLYNVLPLSQTTINVLSDISYEPGRPPAAAPVPAHLPAVLFCFESVDPRGVRKAVGDRLTVPFVAHTVSHAWFARTSPSLQHQLSAMLKVQAAWNDVVIVQAGNAAPSKIFYPSGQEVVFEEAVRSNAFSVQVVDVSFKQ